MVALVLVRRAMVRPVCLKACAGRHELGRAGKGVVVLYHESWLPNVGTARVATCGLGGCERAVGCLQGGGGLRAVGAVFTSGTRARGAR